MDFLYQKWIDGYPRPKMGRMEYYNNYAGELFIVNNNLVHKIGKMSYAPFKIEFCKLRTYPILNINQQSIRYEKNNKSEYIWKVETRNNEINEFYGNIQNPVMILNFLISI